MKTYQGAVRHWMIVSGQLDASAVLLPGETSPPRYPLDQKPRGPQNRSGRCRKEFHAPARIEPRTLVAIPTELSRLLTYGKENRLSKVETGIAQLV
jgi:hypothetical protein